MSPDPLYILGAGMHPWGKWGNDFTEYGVAAAIPTWFLLPCTGTGQVFFWASPPSNTARPNIVAVTFVSQ